MVIDITELAQSLKAAADREMICRDGAETSEIWERTVTPENILALVEALEEAQQRIGKLEKKITDHKRMNQEMAKAMLTPNDSDAAGMEIAALRQRIAELESRTVTVKLPEPPGPMSIGARTVYFGIVAGVVRSFQDGLGAAGIKWEAE